MKTDICPTCGCSLVRLGIGQEHSVKRRHNDREYQFCCQGCVELFAVDPEKYLRELSDLIVCPSCLAEKPLAQAVKLNIAGQDVYFCRCPHCVEVFRKDPDFYLKRLAGEIPNEGVLDHEGCCIRPE